MKPRIRYNWRRSCWEPVVMTSVEAWAVCDQINRAIREGKA